MQVVLGCSSLICAESGLFVGVKCSKGRGITLPGGKWEPGETYKEAAARELLEETGLVAKSQSLLYHGGFMMGEEFHYCYCFETGLTNESVDALFLGTAKGDQGQPLLATWEELLQSDFKAYYSILQELWKGKYGRVTNYLHWQGE